MREINLELIKNSVRDLLVDAARNVNDDLLNALYKSLEKEESPLGKSVIKQIIDNDLLAKKLQKPMCQDTGVAVVMLEIGSEVWFKGDLATAVNDGVREAYVDHFLRKSVVKHPFDRVNTNDNTPAVIHTKIVSGDKIKITVAPKGAGSENMSLVKMLIPSDGIEGVKKLVLDTIFKSGGKPCPPIIVGLGIGGNFETSAIMAKEAIMREIDDESEDPIARKLEKELLTEINNLGVGPMGFGGTVTALAVKINVGACHIASLPVAINIQCHAARHKSIII
ncbi:MAG: fumarate hydratase [Acholeplasmatales bacterium]|nr:fumarate hydratase [Acholeplasmataceae bacterium]MDY0114967.1 fumarate hydratase [Acholeplasmatales bacterium]HHT39018.1 fumarate hydratase [Acholeplasmataceae bacterium]